MPHPIVNSGLSTYTYGDARRVGYVDLLEGLTKAARMLNDISGGWVGLYSAQVDTLSHVLGGGTPQMRLAIRQIEDSVHWMISTLPQAVVQDTTLMVVADHGQADTRVRIPLYGKPMEWL